MEGIIANLLDKECSSTSDDTHLEEIETIRSDLLQELRTDCSRISSLEQEDAAKVVDRVHLVRPLLLLDIRKLTKSNNQHLKTCPANSTDYVDGLRLLQELCYLSGRLPSSYELQGITFDRKHVIGRGGEAIVYRGQMNKQKVAVREVVMPPKDWCSARGREIIQVRFNGWKHVGDFSSDFFSYYIAKRSLIPGLIIQTFYHSSVSSTKPKYLIQSRSCHMWNGAP